MTGPHHGLSKFDLLMKECLEGRALNDTPLPQIFGRLLYENPITGNLTTQHIVDSYIALVDDMKINGGQA